MVGILVDLNRVRRERGRHARPTRSSVQNAVAAFHGSSRSARGPYTPSLLEHAYGRVIYSVAVVEVSEPRLPRRSPSSAAALMIVPAMVSWSPE